LAVYLKTPKVEGTKICTGSLYFFSTAKKEKESL